MCGVSVFVTLKRHSPASRSKSLHLAFRNSRAHKEKQRYTSAHK